MRLLDANKVGRSDGFETLTPRYPCQSSPSYACCALSPALPSQKDRARWRAGRIISSRATVRGTRAVIRSNGWL